MWMKWLPWRMVVRRLARSQGFMDPLSVAAQFERFAQPSEVAVPVEILRLAAVLHSRGLMNSRVIQHNLDWVWPYWVERQFDPQDRAFVPRAFSLTHINLTHRNWTALGLPGGADYPLVDPAGLVTPFYDRWSLDFWVLPEKGTALAPSRLKNIRQKLLTEGNLAVVTEAEKNGFSLQSKAEVLGTPRTPVCRITVTACAPAHACVVAALRPYNPEGIHFIHEIDMLKDRKGWRVDRQEDVRFDEEPEDYAFSHYKQGDVFGNLHAARDKERMTCEVGMATAAAFFELQPHAPRTFYVEVPLKEQRQNISDLTEAGAAGQWQKSLEGACKARIPDKQFQFLYDAALRTLVLHTPADAYPGPYTYKHFWFRDAAFILEALLSAGLIDRAEKVIEHSFFRRQNPFGYFHSQDGEWDSNGQALWTLRRFCELSGRAPKKHWKKPILKAARWIEHKRLSEKLKEPHAGLFPAGFSAEHLGPNDYYYWDDFWGVAGLQAAAYLAKRLGALKESGHFEQKGRDFMACIEKSVQSAADRLGHAAMPASPYRRMDTGAIGSLAAGYPLKLWPAQDSRLRATADYLAEHFFVNGGFFHDMSHSGMNPYLTLHIAQNFLRSGDPRYYPLMKGVADLASPTGQWPEAIHPQTLGGCMGDGQHVWAAAEWMLMLSCCFVREEEDRLILGSGIPEAWLEEGQAMHFGPVSTPFGPVSVKLTGRDGTVHIAWQGTWFDQAPRVEIRLPGREPLFAKEGVTEAQVPLAVRT